LDGHVRRVVVFQGSGMVDRKERTSYAVSVVSDTPADKATVAPGIRKVQHNAKQVVNTVQLFSLVFVSLV